MEEIVILLKKRAAGSSEIYKNNYSKSIEINVSPTR